MTTADNEASIDDIIPQDTSKNPTYKASLARGERIATLAQKTVWTVRDAYRQRGESLEASGLKGGISKSRAVGLIFGEKYLTPEGMYDRNMLASHVKGQDISKLPEVKEFISRHGGIDPTHGPSGRRHRSKVVPSLRTYEPPIKSEPLSYSIACNSPSDLENLLKDGRLQFQSGSIVANVTGPKVGNYLNTLESKGYSIKPLPK